MIRSLKPIINISCHVHGGHVGFENCIIKKRQGGKDKKVEFKNIIN